MSIAAGYDVPKTAVASDGAKRFPLNMRTTEAIRRRLEEAAHSSGRSLAQEVEYRLEQSFQEQEAEVIDLSKVPLLRMLALALKQAEMSTGQLWYKSAEAALSCRNLMLGVIDLMLPAPLHTNRLLGTVGRDVISDQLDAADLALTVIENEGPESATLLCRIEEMHEVARRIASRGRAQARK